MTKTLADMTSEERADCVGMWALIEKINLAVIVEVDETDTCVVVYPEWQGDSAVHLNEMVTPRYDLPRVWTPDGEPEIAQALVEETWEYSIQLKDHTGEWETATNSETHLEEWWEYLKYAEWAMAEEQEHGYSCRIVRRRVSPPEAING